MENNENTNRTPLRALVERIIEKREMTEDEQREVNAVAMSGTLMDQADFEAISKLTEKICSGEIQVS